MYDLKKFYYRIEAVTLQGKKINKCGEFYALKCIPKGKTLAGFTFYDQFTGDVFTLPTSE